MRSYNLKTLKRSKIDGIWTYKVEIEGYGDKGSIYSLPYLKKAVEMINTQEDKYVTKVKSLEEIPATTKIIAGMEIDWDNAKLIAEIEVGEYSNKDSIDTRLLFNLADIQKAKMNKLLEEEEMWKEEEEGESLPDIDFEALKEVDFNIEVNVVKKIDKVVEEPPESLLALNEFDKGSSMEAYNQYVLEQHKRYCLPDTSEAAIIEAYYQIEAEQGGI